MLASLFLISLIRAFMSVGCSVSTCLMVGVAVIGEVIGVVVGTLTVGVVVGGVMVVVGALTVGVVVGEVIDEDGVGKVIDILNCLK